MNKNITPYKFLWSRMILITTVLVSICLRSGSATVAYLALQRNNWELYYQNTLTSKPIKIGSEDQIGDKNAPSISLDDRYIAFEYQSSSIHILSLNSNRSYNILERDGFNLLRPAWHPGNGKLTFVRYLVDNRGEDSEIFFVNRGSKQIKALLSQTGIQDYPDFSLDGRFLVYTSTYSISLHRSAIQIVQQLWVMNLETGTSRQLLLTPAQDIHPDWSPSGDGIAFASNRSGQFEIWVVNADGSGLRQVTSGPGTKTWPAWSPDGKSIMFTYTEDGRQGLSIISADGTQLRPFEPFGLNSDIQLRDADWR